MRRGQSRAADRNRGKRCVLGGGPLPWGDCPTWTIAVQKSRGFAWGCFLASESPQAFQLGWGFSSKRIGL